jgi:hypothetical protein
VILHPARESDIDRKRDNPMRTDSKCHERSQHPGDQHPPHPIQDATPPDED